MNFYSSTYQTAHHIAECRILMIGVRIWTSRFYETHRPISEPSATDKHDESMHAF